MSNDKKRGFLGWLIIVANAIIILLVVSYLGLKLFGAYKYHSGVIAVDKLENLEETNYRIYYEHPEKKGLISSEINGKNQKKLNIPKFGECSPNEKYTVYSEGRISAGDYFLYNFETHKKTKLFTPMEDSMGHVVWTRDGSKVAIVGYPNGLNENEPPPRIRVFNTEGELVEAQEITNEHFKSRASEVPGAVVTSIYREMFGDSVSVCTSTHRIEVLRKNDFKGSKLRFGSGPDGTSGLFYEDEMIMPSIYGLKGMLISRFENILPDGKIVLMAPKTENPSILSSGSYGSYIYIYEPDTDSLYRIGEGVGRNYWADVFWRFKDR